MTANNKQIVTTAYQRIFGDMDTSAVDEYMSKDFIQHNPTIADGPEGVKQLLQMLASQGVPKQKIEFKHVVADGDTVMLHSRYEMAGKEWRFIDILPRRRWETGRALGCDDADARHACEQQSVVLTMTGGRAGLRSCAPQALPVYAAGDIHARSLARFLRRPTLAYLEAGRR